MLKGLLGLSDSSPDAPVAPSALAPSDRDQSADQPEHQPAPVQPATTLSQALKKTHAPRDLQGLDEEEADIFQNMSRKAYDKLLPLYREYKSQFLPNKDKFSKLPELEKQLAAAQQNRWFDHPESYQLTPEFQQTVDKLDQISSIQSHFEAQLDAVEAGAKEYTTLRRGPDGNIQQVKVPVDPSTRRQLLTEIISAKDATKTLTQKIEETKSAHQNRWTSHKSSLQQLDKTLFGEYNEILDAPAKAELQKFPEYFRNDPAAPLLAKAITLINFAGKALEQNKVQQSGAAINQKAAQHAPPSRSGLQPQISPASPTAYSMEEFNALRREGGF